MENIKIYKKIGIMGGTFNPIHNAHLIMSEWVKDKYNLDKVIFIPTGAPPHKSKVISKEHRYNMTKIAIQSNNNLTISNTEIIRQKITRTIDTLNEIKQLSNAEIYFIVGTDTINNISAWKDIDEIFNLCQFIVTTRPNYCIQNDTKEFIRNYKNKIYFCETPLIDISSTTIRKRVGQQKTITYLVPESVQKYIDENNLYKVDYYDKYENKRELLQKILTEKRYKHSLYVAIEAKNLAIEYNFDTEKAYIAGLLHDCCKCYDTNEIYQKADLYKFEIDDGLKNQLYLVHGFLGYYVAKNEYEIQDEDILNSIKYHTTGRKNMSILEKIIYIADYIEPMRMFEGIEQIRTLAYKNLNATMEIILKNTIDLNLSKNKKIHYLSYEAYDYYKK